MKRFLISLIVIALLGSGSVADTVVIGNSSGEIFSRDELNLTTEYGYSNFGATWGPASMGAGRFEDVAIGGADGTPHMRNAKTLGDAVSTTNFTVTNDSAVSAIATRPDGHVAIGTQDNQFFMRDRTDLTLRAPECTADGFIFNGGITAIVTLSSGHIVIGDSVGYVYVRDKDNASLTAPGASVDSVNFGIPISALAVTPDDKVIIGQSSGGVDTRDANDISVSISNINFGISINALAALPNGDVAVGLDNGHVDVRQATDLSVQTTEAAFTASQQAITALAATSGDNLVIGTENNLIFVRQGSDLSQVPDGFAGSDGLNFNAPITSVAAVAGNVTCEDLIAQGNGLATDLSGDCYVDLYDFALFAQAWTDCVEPQDVDCDHPWE